MNIKKTLVVAGTAATLGIAGIGGAGVVSAATNPTSSGDNSLVQKIADKFHLNKSDVQAVFDQDRADRQAARQQRVEDKLTQAVKDGKITQAQKDQILAKLADLKTKMDALRDKTPAERQTAMQQIHDDLQQWAKDNNIPMQYLPLGMGKGGPHGHHMMDSDADDQ